MTIDDKSPSDPKRLLDHICRCCGHRYALPSMNREGFTVWHCPACDLEERIHITPRR
ncbi:hypothetical protein NCG89_03160 [Spongiibacter taiwanensis]|uniref:hypothetical protein n=1 Tax=Spongiibacter taiwanensis TaxID=1748242 RepID=UPI002034CC8A|nr:hypothetical protein [Spongiibacter taiwanensis]USA43790.1 hypothetical protein NCG89_03160 [Spongiibacter taiwanensis]